MIKDIWRFDLTRGASNHPLSGACLLEAVSWIDCGEIDDHPHCACPVLAAFGRELNDGLNDGDRQRLRPLIPLLVGSKDDPAVAHARALYLRERLMHRVLPLLFEAIGHCDFQWTARFLRGTPDDMHALRMLDHLESITPKVVSYDDAQDGYVLSAIKRARMSFTSSSDTVSVVQIAASYTSCVAAVSGYKLFDESAREQLLTTIVESFREAILLGKHGEIDIPSERVEDFARARETEPAR